MKIIPKYLTRNKVVWDDNSTSIVINHNHGTKDLIVQGRDLNDDTMVLFGNVEFTSDNSITITNEEAPTGSGLMVLIFPL